MENKKARKLSRTQKGVLLTYFHLYARDGYPTCARNAQVSRVHSVGRTYEILREDGLLTQAPIAADHPVPPHGRRSDTYTALTPKGVEVAKALGAEDEEHASGGPCLCFRCRERRGYEAVQAQDVAVGDRVVFTPTGGPQEVLEATRHAKRFVAAGRTFWDVELRTWDGSVVRVPNHTWLAKA